MKKVSLKQVAPFLILAVVAVAALFIPSLPLFNDGGKYSSADIAWIIVATALVFLMTPGLAFFYGGMVHRKNVLSTMMKSVVAAGIVSILWVVVGFSLCFGDDVGGLGLIGNPGTFLFFKNVANGAPWSLAPTIPLTLFALFQLMFAIITPGLVVGAVAERIRFTAYTLFIVLFSLLVYAPLAHWSWHPDGFLFKWGVLDFAGGTVVHISAGCAALAGALVLKRRQTHIDKKEIPPANIPYVLIGTGLLWFGWFGFNAGSAVGATALSVSAFATTNTAAAAAGEGRQARPLVRGRVIGLDISQRHASGAFAAHGDDVAVVDHRRAVDVRARLIDQARDGRPLVRAGVVAIDIALELRVGVLELLSADRVDHSVERGPAHVIARCRHRCQLHPACTGGVQIQRERFGAILAR
jgi:Amt family ammonium transporter